MTAISSVSSVPPASDEGERQRGLAVSAGPREDHGPLVECDDTGVDGEHAAGTESVEDGVDDQVEQSHDGRLFGAGESGCARSHPTSRYPSATRRRISRSLRAPACGFRVGEHAVGIGDRSRGDRDVRLDRERDTVDRVGVDRRLGRTRSAPGGGRDRSLRSCGARRFDEQTEFAELRDDAFDIRPHRRRGPVVRRRECCDDRRPSTAHRTASRRAPRTR